MRLTTAQLDRAAGVLLGQACGDALGVPYEFGRRLGPDDEPEMRGGGLGPVQQLRAEERHVLLQCVQAQSRTPAVAARYGVLLGLSKDKAAADVNTALKTHPNPTLADAVRRLERE